MGPGGARGLGGLKERAGGAALFDVVGGASEEGGEFGEGALADLGLAQGEAGGGEREEFAELPAEFFAACEGEELVGGEGGEVKVGGEEGVEGRVGRQFQI